MIRTVSFLLLSTTLSEGVFYISREQSQWSEQYRNCTPATPEVKGADTGYIVHDNHYIDIPVNESVWVGYYQEVRVFEYKGCVLMSNLFTNYEDRPFVEIKGDPGHCFPACGDDTVIGITKSRCYCLESVPNQNDLTETSCTDRCENPVVACGKDYDPMKYSYLSIYKMNLNVIASSMSGDDTVVNNCLTMEPSGSKMFIWDKCSAFLPPMCAHRSSVWKIKFENGENYYSWIGAANICFKNKAFPTTYSNSKNVFQRNGSKLWTGMFKTNVVYKYDAMASANRRDTRKFGYITGEFGKDITLKFTETNSNKRLLCDDGRIYIKETPLYSTKMSSSQKSVITDIPGLSVTTMANVTDMTLSTESSLDTDVIIGVCVPVVLIIAILVVLLICFFRQRRKNKTNQAQGNGKIDTEIQGNNSYSVLEPTESQNDVRINANNPDTKRDLSDNREIKTESVYNQLDDTTYDHATTNSQTKQLQSGDFEMDETYDKSIAVTKWEGVDKDNIYNQSGEDEEDEYNHLGLQVRNFKTDNVYGIQEKPNELEDSDYDINVSRYCDNNGQTDNTYSCLSNNNQK